MQPGDLKVPATCQNADCSICKDDKTGKCYGKDGSTEVTCPAKAGAGGGLPTTGGRRSVLGR